MKHGKFEAHRRRNPGAFAALIALVLTLCCATGGTIAWLTSTPDPVASTFVIGKISIELEDTMGVLKAETANTVTSYTPGATFKANPRVTVKQGSEECFLFIHIDEKNNVLNNEKIIQWTLSSEWQSMDAHPGYYYRTVAKFEDKDVYYRVFGNDKSNIPVNSKLTAENISSMQSNYPQITISAAAVQRENIPTSSQDGKATVTDAWALLPDSFTGKVSGN